MKKLLERVLKWECAAKRELFSQNGAHFHRNSDVFQGNGAKLCGRKGRFGVCFAFIKRALVFLLTIGTALSFLSSCGKKISTAGQNVNAAQSEISAQTDGDGNAELIVFAAASLTETLTELGNSFMAEHDNIEVAFNFDSSGTLKTQIQEGADVDIFISAGQKQMNQLDFTASAEENTEGLDFVLKNSRFNLLENKVALAVPEDNPADIHSFEDMIAGLKGSSILLAMGNSDVPVGQYTQKIFDYYELNEEELASAGCITYGTNAKEVTTQVSEASVDCGIIYQTDAFSAGLTVVDAATKEMCGQVIYPAAVMNVSQNPELAQEFLDFLTSEIGYAAFEAAGFTIVE